MRRDACSGAENEVEVAGEGDLSDELLVFEPEVLRTEGRIVEMRSWYIRIPARISHPAKRYFPKEICIHSLGTSKRANKGVYLYVCLVYGLHKPTNCTSANRIH